MKRDSLRLAWRDFNATGAQGYEVEIVEPSGRVTVKTLNDPQTKESMCPLSAGDGTYRFRVRAFYPDGQRTAFSNTLTVRKKVTLRGVVDLAATQDPRGSGDIVLRWSHPDGDEIETFEVFTWSEGEPQPEQPTVILPGDSLVWVQSFSDGGLVAYRCNFYLVRAKDCFGLVSQQNPVVTQFSAPAPQFDPGQTEVTPSSITVCWSRPEPRLKPDDTFDAVVLVHRDSLTSPTVDSVRFFNKSCFTLLNPEPGHNYIFQVKEIILDDLQQSCSDEFASVFARPLVVPFDNRPPAVSFVVQPLPVLPGSDKGRIFVSWEGFANRAVHRFLVKWHPAGSATADSAEVVDADTLLVTGLDASQRYEFSVIAIDSLGQRSEDPESRTADFSPRWTFTPRVLGFTPGCFRDSVRVAWTWVDENLNPVASALGADSVTVELSIDPNFVFKKTAVKLPVQKEYVFQRALHYPFVNDQNDKLYARVRGEDRWQHVSPWSNEYAELGSAVGEFDALPPAVVTANIDSVKAPVLGGPGTVDVFLRWEESPDNCSGTWFYEIARDQKVIARDTSRSEVHFFVDRDLTSDINLLTTTWEVHAVDSVGNRQALAGAATVPFLLQPPDSGGCLNDTTFCWSPGSANIPDIQLTYFVEGARFPELFGNALTNIVLGPLDSLCVNFNVPWENVFWRVKARVGEFESAWSDTFVCALQNQTVSAIDGQVGGALPQAFDLAQNYPNPFNPTTTIRYAIPTSVANGTRVVLEIFNIAGQRVRTLLDAEKQPGEYVAIWDGRDDSGRVVGSGVYVYRLRAKAFVASHKMILMK
ncbi:MAG: T9SS C-terminal target domain-containing protein [Calditrichaeota bacterium]|nr:MAG: T9SS C-terminal target domain-containing protein [Calditrichota bacterium]